MDFWLVKYHWAPWHTQFLCVHLIRLTLFLSYLFIYFSFLLLAVAIAVAEYACKTNREKKTRPTTITRPTVMQTVKQHQAIHISSSFVMENSIFHLSTPKEKNRNPIAVFISRLVAVVFCVFRWFCCYCCYCLRNNLLFFIHLYVLFAWNDERWTHECVQNVRQQTLVDGRTTHLVYARHIV